MSNIEIILFLCFTFLQLTLVATQIPWEDCDKHSDDIKLLNLTVKPYPIVIPGSASVEITIHTDQDLIGPIKTELTLSKKVLFGYMSIPCVSGIGSCTYDDLCAICPQCGCPLKAGDHVLSMPIYIDTGSWALVGNYQGQVNIQTKSGQKGCVKLSSVHIKSSK